MQADGTVHRARGDALTPTALYGLLRLRVDVFVVEQRCAYAELDGRDLDPTTVHLWTGAPLSAVDVDASPTACLRLLTEPDGTRRIGRVCVAAAHRGRGDARRLVAAALAVVGDGPCVLDAQAHLTAFYDAFGFVPDGPGYDWDGVRHVPMRRAVPSTPAGATPATPWP